MNKLILIIILLLSSLWAVQPVPKDEKTTTDTKPSIRIQVPDNDREDAEQKKTVVHKTPSNKNDQFIDADSNNVNDQREDDLLKIKQLKTKLKDLFKKDNKGTEPRTPSKPDKRTKK
ncbi:MAG: hypothetical protein ABIL22_09185 [candidate division WOR-3 bacterium]